ncbi:MAG: hypothetical protein VB024_11660 [Dysgonamonadaceae bacterium]|jgi:hypothetical protein|nr:hypothetical protein [Dysgonamonadaceae bacterium]MDD3901660.1 hypothetical protein [Dysgonamonadaceae bacterium]MDD4399850.1 hypothetical protein [Dysgonamonadaceae bacterium]MEA5082257.1 hypothetical protein [Dysgonamonadaceae bacterium]
MYIKSYQQSAFLPSNALCIGVSPSFSLFFINSFSDWRLAGVERGKKHPKEQQKNAFTFTFCATQWQPTCCKTEWTLKALPDF